jgi:hypothetical protein
MKNNLFKIAIAKVSGIMQAYVVIFIYAMMNKINDGNNIRDGKKKLRFFIPMYSYCL